MKVGAFTSSRDIAKEIQRTLGGEKIGNLFLKLKEGKNELRLVGDWFEFRKHVAWGKEGNFKSFVCGGETCILCQYVRKLEKLGTKTGDNKASRFRATNRVFWNVISRDEPYDENNKLVLKVLEFGYSVYNDLGSMIGEYGDVTDSKKGRDIIIRKRGKKKLTRYSVDPGQQVPLTKEELNLELHDLERLAGTYNADKIKDFFKVQKVKVRRSVEEDTDDDEEEDYGDDEE